MTNRWLVRSALGMLPLCSLLGCAADTTAPLSAGSGATGISVTPTPNTLNGTVGTTFPFAGGAGIVFTVSGGPPGASYFWTVTGQVPPGLALFPPDPLTPSSTLTLYGVPSTGGTYPLQISVHTADHVLLISGVTFPLEIAGDSNTPPKIPDLAFIWLPGVTYQQALTATGGKTPYTSWSATGLPPEITLDAQNGTLSGTPSTLGTFRAVVRVVDSAGREGTGTISLTVKTWTLGDVEGTWTGLITTASHPLAGKRLSLLFTDQGSLQQGTLDTTILATPAQPLSFTINTGGQLDGRFPNLERHLLCSPTSSGKLACIGHSLSQALPPPQSWEVTLERINASSQDLDPPTVVSGVFAAAATNGTVTVVFSELMSGPGVSGTSLTLSGGPGTTGTPTFPGTDPTAPEARTLTVPLSQLQSNTSYTLTLNPAGQTGFRDVAGNALATRAIPFTTGVLTANQPPIASPLSLSAVQNEPRAITLTGSDPEGLPLVSARIVSPPSRGALTPPTTWSGAGPYGTSYTSADIGFDTFTFTVTDSAGNESSPATVTITTRAANRRPTALTQSVSVVHGRPVPITLTWTDQDAGETISKYTVQSGPANGTLSGLSQTRTYTSRMGFVGTDSFDFSVTDSGGLESNSARVNITVTNQPPTASSQSITVLKGVSTPVTLAGTDLDGDPLTYTVEDSVASNTHGTLTPAGTGSALVTYTPPATYSGTYPLVDRFSFRVNDGANTSAAATLEIKVSANAAPTATPQSFAFKVRQTLTDIQKTQYAITLTGSPSAVAFRIVSWPTYQDRGRSMSMVSGTIYQMVDPNTAVITEAAATTSSVVDPATGRITGTPVIVYTPQDCHNSLNPGAVDSFSFVAINADGLISAPATVTMTPIVATCHHVFN